MQDSAQNLSILTRVVNMQTVFDTDLPVIDKKCQYNIGIFQNAKMMEAVERDVKWCFTFCLFTYEQS